MEGYDRVKMRGERLRKMMDDTLSPDRAWETVHPHHSPPKRYPTPNFLTNPDVNDPRNFRGSVDQIQDEEDDDFYDYLSDEEETKKHKKHDSDEENKAKKQHAIDDEEYMKRVRELEQRKRLDDVRDRVNRDAHQNLIKHQIDISRTHDPFASVPDPLVLQMYLRIYGGMYINPRDIALVHDGDQKLSDMNVFRNTFIQYKDFPKGNVQRTPIMFNTNSPVFNYKAYFPILVREDMIAMMSKFFFVFEVWDQVTPDKHDCVGFAKLSLSCFFKSLVFEENSGMLNTAYFEDDSNAYPMVGFDESAEVTNFEGKCVGWLKLTLALGSPDQVNRFDSIQTERDRARADEEEEKNRQKKRKNQRKGESENQDGKNKEVELLLRELVDTLKDKTSSGGKREKGKWSDNHLDSLRKLFEECRLDNTKDIKNRVFKESTQKCKNIKKVSKALFESDLLDNTALNRKTVNNILELWDFTHNSQYDVEQLQKSYSVY